MITVQTRVLENLYTTAQWAAITDPLPDRVQGHEVAADGSPIGTKIGNGVDLWADLPYWYSIGPAVFDMPYTIPAGEPTTDYPTFIPISDGFTERSRLLVIDMVTLGMTDITYKQLQYAESVFEGWNISLPVATDDSGNTLNACVVWVTG